MEKIVKNKISFETDKNINLNVKYEKGTDSSVVLMDINNNNIPTVELTIDDIENMIYKLQEILEEVKKDRE